MSRLYQRKGAWFVDYSDERKNRVRLKLEGVRTKRDAEAQLAELVAKVNRRRLGLEPAATSLRSTVWQLADWWLKERCPKASVVKERNRLENHLRGSAIGGMEVAHVRAAHFEAWFSELENNDFVIAGRRPLAAGSINHLRAKLRTVFERARREELFNGRNPLADTKLRKGKKKLYETLSADEAVQVLAKVPPQWRGFVAAAIYLGLRKGEIAGLRKSDVDLKQMLLRVGRSYERETTKGGHADLLPIPELMRSHLAVALKTRGLLLFGDEKGRMRQPYSKPCIVLRRAIKNAGIAIGFRLICRRCTTDGKLKAQVVTARPNPKPPCPVCKTRRIWVTPLPRHVRFHDLRHSMATILLRSGMDPHRVQKLMRHASINTTTTTYAHLIVDDLRAGQAVAFGAGGELDLETAERGALVAEILRLRQQLGGGSSVADAGASRHQAATAGGAS